MFCFVFITVTIKSHIYYHNSLIGKTPEMIKRNMFEKTRRAALSHLTVYGEILDLYFFFTFIFAVKTYLYFMG